ncbi:MAG: carbohydrate-binding family 9-like protein [Planctomycetota bacterium]
MQYNVKKVTTPPTIDSVWEKQPWLNVEPLELRYHIKKKPAHFPKTQAKLLYNEKHIYVIFRVEDRYVRAVAKQYHDNVCLDSCVEFFFTPGSDITKGYFNIEINCGGIMLFHFQKLPWNNQTPLPLQDCRQVQIARSMPGIVESEITQPTTWTIEYALPLQILEKYTPVTYPARGKTWRAGLYKCADKTSHPHWLSWTPIPASHSSFHTPQHFGTLGFI